MTGFKGNRNLLVIGDGSILGDGDRSQLRADGWQVTVVTPLNVMGWDVMGWAAGASCRGLTQDSEFSPGGVDAGTSCADEESGGMPDGFLPDAFLPDAFLVAWRANDPATLELIAALRRRAAEGAGAAVPILVLADRVEASDAEAASAAGADDLLIAPLAEGELRMKLRFACAKRQTPPAQTDARLIPGPTQDLGQMLAIFCAPGGHTTSCSYVSDELCALFGYTPGSMREVHGNRILELIHADDRARVVESTSRCPGVGNRYEVEYRVHGAHQTLKWVRERGSWRFNEQQQMWERVGYLIDITHEKELKEALRRETQQLTERKKEMNVVRMVSNALQLPGASIETKLERIADILVSGFTRPDLTSIRIEYGDRWINSRSDAGSQRVFCETFTLPGGVRFAIEVSFHAHYGDAPSTTPFLEEEREMVRFVGNLIRTWIQLALSEASIRESEQRYRVLAETSLDMISLHKADGTYSYASPACRELLGREPNDLVGLNPYELVHPDDREIVRESHERLLRHGMSTPVTYRLRHGRGDYIWVESTTKRLEDQTDRIVVVSRDVSIRKLTEDALRGSEMMLRDQRLVLQQIIGNIPHAICWKDRYGRYLGGNDRFAELVGVSDGQAIIGRDDSQLNWPQEQSERIGRLDKEVVRTGTPLLDLEEPLETNDGNTRIMLTSRVPWSDADGQVIGLICIRADITDRKRSEDAMRESEANLHAITSQLPAVLWTTDRMLHLQSLNGAMIGYFIDDAGQMIGRHVNRLLEYCSNDGAGAVQQAHERALLGQSVSLSQKWGEHETEIFVEPLHDQEGQVTGCLTLVLDVTERNQARLSEREREHMREAIAAMEQVLGVIGHELRTPLTGLRAMSEFLLSDVTSPEHGNFLRSINEEVVRMSGMVDSLLEAARINSGRAQWNWTVCSVRELVEGAASLIQSLIDPDRVSLISHVELKSDEFAGDCDAVHRLLVNLLSNSAKHTTEGRIELSAREKQEDGERWIEFVVRDDGGGIPPETVKKLGEAFALNSGVIGTSHVRGSGLGLSICRGIVHAHGGRISVDSTVGVGTTFTVQIRADLPGPVKASADICPIEYEGQHV
ncbi:MAG: PAS domain S-box protein [Phycisphaerales bacterium]|nr:MAG: PAS domain S-box protein [Phycisphaerales bacterium]